MLAALQKYIFHFKFGENICKHIMSLNICYDLSSELNIIVCWKLICLPIRAILGLLLTSLTMFLWMFKMRNNNVFALVSPTFLKYHSQHAIEKLNEIPGKLCIGIPTSFLPPDSFCESELFRNPVYLLLVPSSIKCVIKHFILFFHVLYGEKH